MVLPQEVSESVVFFARAAMELEKKEAVQAGDSQQRAGSTLLQGSSPRFVAWLATIVGACNHPHFERQLVEQYTRGVLLLASTGKPSPGRRAFLCAMRDMARRVRLPSRVFVCLCICV